MRIYRWIFPAIALLAFFASNSLWAHGGHSHSRLSIGFGYYAPGFYGGYGYGGYGFGGYGFGYPFYPNYYQPWYTYPPTVVVPTTPPVYIERQEAQPERPAQPQSNYWYYCRDPDGYYPYVKSCPDGWLQVAPQPSDR